MMFFQDDAITVTGVTRYLQSLIDADEVLADLWVRGEVSNMSFAASGHWYFTIKDDESQIDCAMWKQNTQRQSYRPQEGEAIRVHGRVSIYGQRGKYQLYADSIQPAGGLGDLYQRYEEVKRRLEAEGLFDPERKRPIPLYPRCIGIVTSPDAAALRDMRNVLARRYPLAQVLLSPTLVQGADAPAQIVRALQRLNARDDVDVILLARGGGSIEDLWSFNEEGVARAIANSRIPVISGVGHETDTTIADFVADLRAPTPSAAAELATPDRETLRMDVLALTAGLQQVMTDQLAEQAMQLAALRRTFAILSPATGVRNWRQRVDERTSRLAEAHQRYRSLWRERLHGRISALNNANPDAILARGYAIVTRTEDGHIVRAEADAVPGTGLSIRLQLGELKARVEDKETHGRYKRTLF